MEERGHANAGGAAVVTDERLQGTFEMSFDIDSYFVPGSPPGERAPRVAVVEWRIENAGGAWAGSFVTMTGEDPADLADLVVTMEGSGGYEGLVAVTAVDYQAGEGIWNVRGYIIDRALPLMFDEGD